MKSENFLRVALAIMFVLCLFQMPYGYYQFVRLVGMVGMGWLAYTHSEREERGWMVFWAASALLINPFVKISLGRELWNVVDVVWAVVLLYQTFRDRTRLK